MELQTARSLKNQFDSLGIGYNGHTDCGFLVGPKPFLVSGDDVLLLKKQGETMRLWMETTLQLTNRSCRDKSLAWLAEMIEAGSSPQVVALHRKMHRSGMVGLPIFARPDMPRIGKSVEVQTPGSGWGYMTAIHQNVPNSSWIGPVGAFQTAASAVVSENADMGYMLYNPPFANEVKYFCDQVAQSGGKIALHYQSLPQNGSVRFLRRSPLEEFVTYSGAEDVVSAILDSRIVAEPSLSLLYDQKLAVLFPFLPALRDCYPDVVRELFPQTWLVERGMKISLRNVEYSLDEIVSLSRSNRQLILKYAGAAKGKRAGGKEVYNLADQNSKNVQELLARAVTEWETCREPWILQERIVQKYPVTYYNSASDTLEQASQYALFRPMYMFLPGQEPQIIAFTVLSRKEWKVHGSTDSIMLAVEKETDQ